MFHGSVCVFFTFILVVFIFIITAQVDCQISLYAPFNAMGIRGNITFLQSTASSSPYSSSSSSSLPSSSSFSSSPPLSSPTSVIISINLNSNSNYGKNLTWAIYSNPVFYGSRSSCSKAELGKVEHKLSDRHGFIILQPSIVPSFPYSDETTSLPSSPSSSLAYSSQSFVDHEIQLLGLNSIWGHSILISDSDSGNNVACTNIFSTGKVKTWEVTFTNNFAGKIIFRENELGNTLIYSNLFHTSNEYRTATKHDWKILVTDVLDTVNRLDKCHYLNILLDPDARDDKACSQVNHANCKMGDLTKKHGQIVIGSANNRYSKVTFMDTNLPLSTFSSSSRQLFIVLYDSKNARSIFSCAELKEIPEREVKAEFNFDGVKGFVRFSQRYSIDPTVSTINFKNLLGRGRELKIHEYPLSSDITIGDIRCHESIVGHIYNPLSIVSTHSPLNGTDDQYAIGDLSGKYGLLPDTSDNLMHFTVSVDMNLPLFGPNSIIGRSVVIYGKSNQAWICSNIGYPDEIITAEATFHYPVYGRVIFRQLSDNPWSETTVLAQLSYSDSTTNDTENHSWTLHENSPGVDSFNWSRRCHSVGDMFNPFNTAIETSKTSKCSPDNPLRCALGDLTSKSKRVNISAFRGSSFNKVFYRDLLLPLSGQYSIIGRSVVIHDETGPLVRGDRLACTVIKKVHQLTATVRKWRGSSTPPSGSVVLQQSSDLDKTYGRIRLHGLNGTASGFHIHQVWVPIDKEFPCSADSLYEYYNPTNLDVSVGPLPGASTNDQYEVGDLSGKLGLLDSKTTYQADFTDEFLPLHGPISVVGRAIVIHKKEKSARWVCGTLSLEVPKDEAREIVAIASFDDPRHAVTGYIRFRQYEYKDGSLSPTWLEVDLKYPGLTDRNVTHGHDWSVFVNQVGEDAYNNVPTVRCIASGYRWNPYLIASDNPLYKKDCQPVNQLRCEMGDLTGKHGHLTIGGQKYVLSDVNLPLAGNYSIMKRSIVIFDKNRLKLACANINPDAHLVTSVAVKRHPSFSVDRFLDHMRSSLATSPWLVVGEVDSVRSILDGECVQITIHFYGSDAYRNQVEFSNLINLGNVRKSISGQFKLVSTFYKPCRSLDEVASSINSSSASFGVKMSFMTSFVIISPLMVSLSSIIIRLSVYL